MCRHLVVVVADVEEEEAGRRRWYWIRIIYFVFLSLPSLSLPLPIPLSLFLQISYGTMVLLSIHSANGNAGSRYFAYSGHLALTPCVIQGCPSLSLFCSLISLPCSLVVKVKNEEELKSLQAKSLTVAVKCYESRLGRVNVIATNVLVDQTLVLWEKSPNSVSAEIPDGEYPFKFLIPPDTPGLTTTIFQEYRAYWRVEAVLEHLPIFGVGNRLVRHFELPLLRYDTPPCSPSTSPPSSIAIQSPKSRLPIYRCTFSTPPPSSPIGPGELVSTFLRLQPIDPSFSVRSATMSIERRLDLRLSPESSSTRSPTPPHISTESFSSFADQSPSKSMSTTIIRSETLEFSLDPTGALSKTITARWPPRKQHTWTVGETMTSGLVTVKFYVHLRVSYLPSTTFLVSLTRCPS